MRNGDIYRCDRCGAEARKAAETKQWDWFRGYLDRTCHYCHVCKDSAEARAMFDKSRTKPSNAELT